MTDKTAQYIYDEVPYPSHSFSWTHPSHLATLAVLLGMHPSPVEHCRVLELGGASGGNLIPMAYGLPESEFVGIDLSARQIADGQAMVTALGLKNITLNHMNILDIGPDFGQFDYIIAHGVYSWVPTVVQDKILEICRQNLAPNGVAYVSYNTYPGWHMLGAVRDMMLYHTRQVTEPEAKALEARALIDFLAKSVPEKNSPHAGFLNAYLDFFQEHLMPKSDGFLLHDELEEVNEPVYFYQFMERATRHGLQYLAEARFQSMLASNLPTEVSEALRQMVKSTIELEQYMDFLRNRTFRQTLLCHQDVRLSGRPNLARLQEFYVASSARAEASEPDIHSVSVEKFQAVDGTALSTDHPVTKAAMIYLAENWPRAIAFNDLLTAARARVNGAPVPINTLPNGPSDAQVLGANLLQAYGYSENLVNLHVHEPYFMLEISEQPVASPVARLQAQSSNVVTNPRHLRVSLEEIDHRLLPYLDGSRDRADLLKILEGLAREGIIKIQQDDDESVKDPKQARQNPGLDERSILAERLDRSLHQLARSCLLVG